MSLFRGFYIFRRPRDIWAERYNMFEQYLTKGPLGTPVVFFEDSMGFELRTMLIAELTKTDNYEDVFICNPMTCESMYICDDITEIPVDIITYAIGASINPITDSMVINVVPSIYDEYERRNEI